MPLVAFISTPELMLWFRLISYVLRPMGLISEREFILGTGIRGYEDMGIRRYGGRRLIIDSPERVLVGYLSI